MFFAIKNSTNESLFVSEDMSVVKKELKKIVYNIRKEYMNFGKVYANYKMGRTSVSLSFVPYNTIGQIEKILQNFEIVLLDR